MGLRCSLLGHDYGEPEIEREREEQGNEVVVTVREFKECSRCGDRSVVSENKEVTAIEDPEPNPEPPESQAVETEPVNAVDAGTTSDVEEPSTFDDGFEPPESAEEDDGVILDDDDEAEAEPDDDDERGHGEWPASDDTEESTDRGHGEWPDADGEDEGFDARPDDGDGADVEFGGGLTPEDAPEVEDDAEFVEAEPQSSSSATTAQEDTGFTRAREAPKPDQAAETTLDADLVCPECGHVDDVTDSSLRAGDICPECRKGYLSERT
jgi:hypothetical protein